MGCFGRRAAKLSNVWMAEGSSLRTDVAVQMQRLTLDVVGQVAFSHNFGQIEAMERIGAKAGENQIPTDRILHDINVAQVRNHMAWSLCYCSRVPRNNCVLCV